jgi:hypothetical protein
VPVGWSGSRDSFLAKSGVIGFNIENNATMPGSLISVDKNKFMMKGNLYEENFAGHQSSIVTLHGLWKIHMSGEVYKNNVGAYREALHYYGTLTSNETSVYSLKEIYSGTFYTFQSVVDISSTFYLHADNLTFENNAVHEITINDVSDEFSGNTLKISYCH